MCDIAVEAKGLTKIYQLGKVKVHALRGIDMRVTKGEFVAVVGPSGSGKTTLLNILGCIDRPTSGNLSINGKNVSALNDSQLSELRCREIGFVFQFFNLIPTLTAFENIELPMMYIKLPRKERERRCYKLLETVGLREKATHKPAELSGGEQQRVALARALANDPSLVLTDEPTGNLDSKTATEIIKLMRELNENYNKTFICATHSIELTKVADRILFIKDGVIVES